jgi:hypothetical protein
MIKLQNELLQNFKVSLLCDFKELKQNLELAELANMAKFGGLENKTIEKGIIKKINEMNLLNDKRFLKEGYFYRNDKNLIELDLFKYDKQVYVKGHEVIYKTSHTKYDGEVADVFKSMLRNYEKFDGDELGFSIEVIHDMGFYTNSDTAQCTFVCDNEVEYLELLGDTISSNNSITKAISHDVQSKIQDLLPGNMKIRSNKLYFTKSDAEALEFLNDLFEDYKLFNLENGNLKIQNEQIYIDSLAIAEELLVKYIIKKYKTTLLTFKDVKNIVYEMLNLEIFHEISNNVNMDNLFMKIEKTIHQDKTAEKHFNFAKDILEVDELFTDNVIDFSDLKGKLEDVLFQQLFNEKQIIDIYIASKYIARFNLQKSLDKLDSGAQKKRHVLDILKLMSKKHKFNLHVLTDQSKQESGIHFVKTDLKKVHGRYLVIKTKNSNSMYKLDAELDHYDVVGDSVIYKDLLVTKINDSKQLPAVIRERVGL